MRILYIFMVGLIFNCNQQPKDTLEEKRMSMVEDQIITRGIMDRSTIQAMKKVPRHLFVPENYISQAYRDGPLPIGYGQTISQPYIVAYMTEVVKPEKGKRALEIGTGSGYQAAVLAEIIDTVYTIEIVPELAKEAETRLKELGYKNIIIRQGDGYKGWSDSAPFDIIIVTAAPNHIPQPLIDQLAEGGRIVIPIGEPSSVQSLVLVSKDRGKINTETLTLVRFVPFTRE